MKFLGQQNKKVAQEKYMQYCLNTNIFISADKITRHSMSSAEVVRGGVSTDEISSKTLESKLCSGLYFTGEVLDVTGDLGGYNLHWAWASGYVAGENA